jgi:hypothetical protein
MHLASVERFHEPTLLRRSKMRAVRHLGIRERASESYRQGFSQGMFQLLHVWQAYRVWHAE